MTLAERTHEFMGTRRAQVVVLALLSAALLAGGVWPAVAARRAMAAHRAESARLASATAEAAGELRNLTARVADLRARAASVEVIPPDPSRVNAQVGALLTTAERAGLSVDDVSVSQPEIEDGDAFSDVTINADARLGALIAFFGEVGGAHPYFGVDAVTINAGRSRRDGVGPADAAIRLTLVWRGRERTPAAVRYLEEPR